jgi:hypothetical protein
MFSISLLRYVTLSKITLIKRGIHLPLKILIRARTGAPISLSRHDKGLATIIVENQIICFWQETGC